MMRYDKRKSELHSLSAAHGALLLRALNPLIINMRITSHIAIICTGTAIYTHRKLSDLPV